MRDSTKIELPRALVGGLLFSKPVWLFVACLPKEWGVLVLTPFLSFVSELTEKENAFKLVILSRLLTGLKKISINLLEEMFFNLLPLFFFVVIGRGSYI